MAAIFVVVLVMVRGQKEVKVAGSVVKQSSWCGREAVVAVFVCCLESSFSQNAFELNK